MTDGGRFDVDERVMHDVAGSGNGGCYINGVFERFSQAPVSWLAMRAGVERKAQQQERDGQNWDEPSS